MEVGSLMSMLLFYVGGNAYAVDNCAVLRVFPLIEANRVTSGSTYLSGMLDVGGEAVPIIDFCQLIADRPAAEKLSTRTILVRDPLHEDEHVVGITGEKVQGFLNVKKEEFDSVDLHMTPYPFLTHLFTKGGVMVQYLDLGAFFTFLSSDLPPIKEKIWKKKD